MLDGVNNEEEVNITRWLRSTNTLKCRVLSDTYRIRTLARHLQIHIRHAETVTYCKNL